METKCHGLYAFGNLNKYGQKATFTACGGQADHDLFNFYQ